MLSKAIKILAAIMVLSMLTLMGCAAQVTPDEDALIVDLESTPSPTPAATDATTAPDASATPTAQDPSPTPDNSDLDGIPDPKETPVPVRTLKEYQKINDDVIGWIKVPNTKINYPVVRGSDNEYYLRNNVEKKKSKAGAIFMDYRNGNKDQQNHLIVYGHNMRDGSMFHDLNNYKTKSFFDKNKTITLTINGKDQKYEVYAAYIVEIEKTRYIDTRFDSEAAFADYMNNLAKLSKFDTGVAIKATDQVLTLSTCTYEYDKSRFVVQARKV